MSKNLNLEGIRRNTGFSDEEAIALGLELGILFKK